MTITRTMAITMTTMMIDARRWVLAPLLQISDGDNGDEDDDDNDDDNDDDDDDATIDDDDD